VAVIETEGLTKLYGKARGIEDVTFSVGAGATGFSLRTSVVTGAVAGVLVSMYLIDLIGRLDPDLSGVRYVSVFKYYGNAIEDGIDPLAFAGVTLVAFILAAIGAWLFERRDLAG
jgi:ABC-2 type transport system permease protein